MRGRAIMRKFAHNDRSIRVRIILCLPVTPSHALHSPIIAVLNRTYKRSKNFALPRPAGMVPLRQLE